jgi:hypothetical protein
MKKLIVCILCLASTQVFAQFRLGLEASFSAVNCWQNEQISGLPTGAQTREMNGFHAGLRAEYDLGYSGFIIQPSLVFSENGTNFGNTAGFVDNADYSIGYASSYMRIYSLRLPVNLLYKFAITNKWRVFAGFGPYLAKNLSGTEKGYVQVVYNANQQVGYFPINNTMKSSNAHSYGPGGTMYVTAFDLGADFLLGVSYKKFDISASFNRGFTQIYRTAYTGLGNQFWDFTVAYTILGHYRKPKL